MSMAAQHRRVSFPPVADLQDVRFGAAPGMLISSAWSATDEPARTQKRWMWNWPSVSPSSSGSR